MYAPARAFKPLTTREIRQLQARLGVAVLGGGFIRLSLKESAYLDGLLRSHIIWREWLVPGE